MSKTAQMSTFCQNMTCGYRDEAGGRAWVDLTSMCRECEHPWRCDVGSRLIQHWVSVSSRWWLPAKTRRLANAVLQLSEGRRRWVSIKLALGERLSCIGLLIA